MIRQTRTRTWTRPCRVVVAKDARDFEAVGAIFEEMCEAFPEDQGRAAYEILIRCAAMAGDPEAALDTMEGMMVLGYGPKVGVSHAGRTRIAQLYGNYGCTALCMCTAVRVIDVVQSTRVFFQKAPVINPPFQSRLDPFQPFVHSIIALRSLRRGAHPRENRAGVQQRQGAEEVVGVGHHVGGDAHSPRVYERAASTDSCVFTPLARRQ